MGTNVPDLRGLFLRGHGSQAHYQNNGSTVGVTSTTHQSGSLGMVQGDAIRNITGGHGSTYYSAGGAGALYSGTLVNLNQAPGSSGFSRVHLDVSRVVSTANENRPVNTAVRYLVRATK
jgi:hypothetical protein